MPTPRRSPVQARSRARVDAILDAADAVFLERGYADATTNHVAARAGTSIGSLYRFFPDKEALLVALAARYGERMRALASSLTGEVAPRTLYERVAEGIDAFHAFLVASPGFRTIVEEARHPALRAGAQAHEAAMAGIVGEAHTRFARAGSPEELATVAEVTTTVLGALQLLAITVDEAAGPRVLAEAKLLVAGYLSRRLGIPEDVPLGSSE